VFVNIIIIKLNKVVFYMKKTSVIYLLIFIVSIVVSFSLVPLRGGHVTVLGLLGFPLSLVVGCILSFGLTLFFLNKYTDKLSKNKVLFTILLGSLILELPVRIFSFNSTLISLPESVFRVFAIVVAYGIFRIKSVFGKIVTSVLFFSLCLWFSYYGYHYWMHKLYFGSFTGKTEQVVATPLVFQNDLDENIFLNEVDGKYLVFDFWTSSCGVCFMRFPHVQRIHERWNNDQIQVYGVFCRKEKREETPAIGTKMLSERGYTFHTLSIDINNPALEEMGISAFPTVLIFDKDRTIIFRGDILQAEKHLEKILE